VLGEPARIPTRLTPPGDVWPTPTLLRRWRLVAPTSFLVLLLGFVLVPDTYPALRTPLVLLVAAFAGLSGEMMAPSPPPGIIRSLWVVPAGLVLVLASWFADVPERPGGLALAAAVAVLVVTGLQAGEWSGRRLLFSTSHAISIGLGYALALRVFYLATGMPVPVGAAVGVAVSAVVTLVVLRGPEVPLPQHAAFTGVAALVAGELFWVLLASPAPPLVCGLLGLLGLYATSSLCHAMLDQAPPRAYVEVLAVTLTSFLIVTLALVRR
jgi:hypothetical protein